MTERRYRLQRPARTRRWGQWSRVSDHRTIEQGRDAYRIMARFETVRLVDRMTDEVVEPRQT